MSKSFEEQYPGYDLIPSKEPKWKGPLLLVGSLLAMAAIAYGTFKELGNMQMPLANMAGVNPNTVTTLKNLALSQARSGDYAAAAKNFDDYFRLGGNDPEARRTAEAVKSRLNSVKE